MTSSRDTVLGRVRQALGRTGADPAAVADAQAYLDAHARGPAPAFDTLDPQTRMTIRYRPETERLSHYSGCSLPQQFDAYVWFDETAAVTPLPTQMRKGAEETYPFGL